MKILIIILLNLIVYWRTIFFEFVSDDATVFKDTKEIPPDNIFKRFWQELIGQKYYVVNNSGTAIKPCYLPIIPHIVVLILHTINCVLIYFALGGLFNNYEVSFITALFFAVNPINSQVSIWLSGKGYSISTMLALLMFCFPMAAPIFWFLTKFWAVNAIFSPLAFVGSPYWYWALLPGLVMFYYKNVIAIKKNPGLNKEMTTFYPRKLILFVKTYGYYFRLCIIPYPIGIYHAKLEGIGLNKYYNDENYALDNDFWIGLGILYIVVTNILFNWCPLSWGLFWFSINIMAFCNIITISMGVSERYVYLAAIGIMFSLANILIAYPIACWIYFTGLLIRLWFIMPMYKNEMWFRMYNFTEHKNCGRIWLAQGMTHFEFKNFIGALSCFLEARELNPGDFKINYNCGMLNLLYGQFGEALDCFDIAEVNYYENDTLKEQKGLIEYARQVYGQATKGEQFRVRLAK